MKILSRNVNGIRAVVGKWFVQTIQRLNPDVICLQETKAFVYQCPAEVLELGYEICRHAGTRAGYAGTAILTKNIPHYHCNIFHESMFHEDGRLTQVAFGDTIIINGYFPNGGTRADGTEMLSYKLAFYDALIVLIDQHHADGKQLIVVWDYNVCHTAIDIARPKENQTSIWFLAVERDKVSAFLSRGMVDVFRHLYPEATGQYTWWSYRAWAKQNNVWRRIDYACVSQSLIDRVTWFAHYPDISGSDHCPLMIQIDL